jgi:hypothetical protein
MGVDLRWSVHQGWLEASTVFRSVLESSRLPLSIPQALHGSEVNAAWVSSWRDYFAVAWLGGDVFPRGVVRWTG